MQRAQRQAAAFGFLRWLEASHGGLRELATAGPSEVAVLDGRQSTNALSRGALDRLFRHEVCAVHVRGYFGAKASEQLAQHMLKLQTRNWEVDSSASQKGMESSDVQSVGFPYNVALSYQSEAVMDEYFEQARQTERELRWWVAFTFNFTLPARRYSLKLFFEMQFWLRRNCPCPVPLGQTQTRP